MILMIIAPENFRDEELFETKEELEKAGHKTVVASASKGICRATYGGSIESTLTIDEVNTNDYEAVVFVGGSGSRIYFDSVTAINIAKEMYEQNKVVAAICIASVILANAGLLKNKKATVYESEIETIKNKGADFTGQDVSVDGRIVTANGPKSSRLFGQKIATLLK